MDFEFGVWDINWGSMVLEALEFLSLFLIIMSLLKSPFWFPEVYFSNFLDSASCGFRILHCLRGKNHYFFFLTRILVLWISNFVSPTTWDVQSSAVFLSFRRIPLPNSFAQILSLLPHAQKHQIPWRQKELQNVGSSHFSVLSFLICYFVLSTPGCLTSSSML